MKKSILFLAAIFSIAVVFTSCKETKKKEVKTENHDGHDHDMEKHEDGKDGEMASHDNFQCPMDCEKGKTYEEKGSCPVCKMDLKKQAGDNDMKHADDCKCKEGGECKCADGKCECKTETAMTKEGCSSCASGKCDHDDHKEGAKTASADSKKCAPGSCKCKA